MTATQEPLWPKGWDLEPCADADERAHVDLHGPLRRRSPTGFDAGPWHGYARPATRAARKFNPYRAIDNVLEDL